MDLVRAVDEWINRHDVRQSHDPTMWTRWAGDVLAKRGLLPELPAQSTIWNPQADAWRNHYEGLHSIIQNAKPRSTEWFAARILASGALEAAWDTPCGQIGREESRAMIVGELLAEVAELRLLPRVFRDMKTQVGRQVGARNTNALRRDLTATLARRFDDFQRKHPGLTKSEAADAFISQLPADVAPRGRNHSRISGESLLRRFRARSKRSPS